MEKLYKIAIDTKGSDKGEAMMVKGAVMALEKHPSLAVCLVGSAKLIESECKALGADMTYALPDSEISVMDPAAAVAFLWNDRITEQTTRAELENEWKETQASATAAAADGSIDDVIDAAELRQRICSAVYMLLMKNSGTPARRHCNLPL